MLNLQPLLANACYSYISTFTASIATVCLTYFKVKFGMGSYITYKLRFRYERVYDDKLLSHLVNFYDKPTSHLVNLREHEHSSVRRYAPIARRLYRTLVFLTL